MERNSVISTVKDEVTTGAKVSLKVAKPVMEAAKPFAMRSLGKEYKKFIQNLSALKRR